jgi:hypothetical protein
MKEKVSCKWNRDGTGRTRERMKKGGKGVEKKKKAMYRKISK